MGSYPVLLFFDVSGGELIVILVVLFLVLGPEKMPDVARKVGKAMNTMKKATNDLTREFQKETSVIQDEISKAHSAVNEGVQKIDREISSTKKDILSGLNPDSAVPEKTAFSHLKNEAMTGETDAAAAKTDLKDHAETTPE